MYQFPNIELKEELLFKEMAKLGGGGRDASQTVPPDLSFLMVLLLSSLKVPHFSLSWSPFPPFLTLSMEVDKCFVGKGNDGRQRALGEGEEGA